MRTPQPAGSGGIGAGQKVCAVAGVWSSKSQNGNPQIVIHLVCLRDEEDSNDEGLDGLDFIPYQENCYWRLDELVFASGRDEPYDESSVGAIRDVLTGQGSKAFHVTFESHEWQGKTKIRPAARSYVRFDGEPGEDWDDLIDNAMGRSDEIKRRMEERQTENGSGRQSRGGGRYGGSGRGYSRPSEPAPEPPPYTDDDIPF